MNCPKHHPAYFKVMFLEGKNTLPDVAFDKSLRGNSAIMFPDYESVRFWWFQNLMAQIYLRL